MLWAQEGSSKSVESVHDSNLKSGIQTKVQKGDFKSFSHVQIFDYSVMSVRSWSFLLDGSKKARCLLKNQLYSNEIAVFFELT